MIHANVSLNNNLFVSPMNCINPYAFTLALLSPFHLQAQSFANLPEPVTNNAVTQVTIDDAHYLVSFSGLAANKTDQDVHNKTFVYSFEDNQWQQKSSVPIRQPIIDSAHPTNKNKALIGRLASIATSVNQRAYVFGGYTVASDHSEVSVPDVYSYDIKEDVFTPLMSMPVPVDDSIALAYQDRYIYLVSGWHNDGNVNLVQVYDTQLNQWSQATPFPGSPVFGHAGAMIDNNILVCDGVKIQFHASKRRTYAAEPACYFGKVNPDNHNVIDWRIVPHPTGTARYRMAASADLTAREFVFIGGSDNPYNYNGIGYNGKPSTPDNKIWRFNLNEHTWNITQSQSSTMDHRGLIILDGHLITVGGMGRAQTVLDTVTVHTAR